MLKNKIKIGVVIPYYPNSAEVKAKQLVDVSMKNNTSEKFGFYLSIPINQ